MSAATGTPASPPEGCRHCGLPVAAGADEAHPAFCCFGCRIADALARPAQAGAEGGEGPAVAGTLLLRLGVGIFLSLNIMAVSWLSYSREVFADPAAASLLEGLFRYLALFLATAVVALLGTPLLGGVLGGGAGRGVPGLILLGVLSAYVLSVIHTLEGSGPLYFDTCALILVAVTLGGYLEAGAKRRAASSASRLLGTLPGRVTVRRGAAEAELPLEEVAPGDLVRLLPGDTVPVDGTVLTGESRIDEASLTGESQARAAGLGERLLAGSLCLDGQLWIRAEEVGAETVLAHMERSLAAARAGRPPIQRLADRVAAFFLPSVALLALAVLGLGALQGRPAEGLLSALAVLLISCPCALGLAAPLASWQGLRRAAEAGILIDSAATLERAAGIDRIFFDKTGTLGLSPPKVRQVETAPDLDPARILGLAAGLESASRHPIAEGLLALARRRGLDPAEPETARVVPGRGMEGSIGGRTYRLGSARWLEEAGLASDPLASLPEDRESAVSLFTESRVLGRFELRERPRPEAPEAVSTLRALGLEPEVLSGDRPRPTRLMAESLGIPGHGGLLPADKVERLRAAREGGSRVAMVGDGLNDAPVLAAADLGIAMGSAAEVARRAGNVRLASDDLRRIPLLLAIARDVRLRIRLNLTFAFGFNSIGILLAAAGRLTPVLAALAMLLSSLTVVRISSGAGRCRIAEAARGTSRGRTAGSNPSSGALGMAWGDPG